ncbi:hypothetical protein HDV57DRAFT_416277 [Trichoderma longibrachiatum]|uniref:Uncharacterized protein n=1 Tax=Trichoderma longibrachiatum ATCC 18648 TaxID=983965 RepID=A0A2T4C2W9_TRILO|nr:hypothetical protein M440DRAFT_1263334 [Trichoderma longibrachiatum ATCC 18648]
MLELLSAAINSYVAASARGEGGQPLPSTIGQMSISRFLVSFFAIPPPIVPDTLHIRVTAPCKSLDAKEKKRGKREGLESVPAGLILGIAPLWRPLVLGLIAGGARRVGLAGETVVVGAEVGCLAAFDAAVIDRSRGFEVLSHDVFFFLGVYKLYETAKRDSTLSTFVGRVTYPIGETCQ